jgi:hypothetical protein
VKLSLTLLEKCKNVLLSESNTEENTQLLKEINSKLSSIQLDKDYLEALEPGEYLNRYWYLTD